MTRWLALAVGGQRIGVYLVRRASKRLEGDASCDGLYDPTKCRIYIADDLAPDAREDTLFHELDHVVNDISGATMLLRSTASGSRRRTLDELEESLVRVRTPIWHRLLKDLGFVFPKGPTE